MVVKAEFTEDDGHIVPCAVKKLKRKFFSCEEKLHLNSLIFVARDFFMELFL